MDRPIQNQDELWLEIERLKQLKQEQSAALAKRFSSPFEAAKTLWSLFPSSAQKRRERLKRFLRDPVIFASKLLVPLLLKKTLLRKSDFLTRWVVMFASSKLAGLINLKRLGNWAMAIEKHFKRKSHQVDA